MKIAVDVQGLQTSGSRQRGIGRYVQEVVEGLIRSETTIDYRLIAHGELPRPNLSESAAQAPLTCVPFVNTSLSDINDLLMRTALVGANADAYFLPSPMEMSDAPIPDIADLPLTTYAICYDLIPLIYQDKYLTDSNLRTLYMRRLRNLRNADSVMAISESTRQDVIRHLGISPDRVVNIGTGTSAFFGPIAAQEHRMWRERFKKNHAIDGPFILYTGGEDWRKNIGGLIEAFALLPSRLRKERQLVVACRISAQGEQKLRECVSQAGLSDRDVIFTNFISDEDLRALYSLCELFVFPSYYEGFGLPLVEALACGAPVITANNSSLVEIVPSPDQWFDARYPASIADRIQCVLKDSDLRQSLIADAVGISAQFTWSSVVERVRAVLANTPVRGREAFNFVVPASSYKSEIEQAGKARSRVERATDSKRIAVFSPLPPLRSGISDYTEDLLPALSQHYLCDLYVDEGYKPIVETGNYHDIFKSLLFANNAGRNRAYRAVLYQMGNSNYHTYMYAALQQYAGITVLHDYSLNGLLIRASTSRPELGISFAAELTHAYGSQKAQEILHEVEAQHLTVEDLPEQNIYTNRRAFSRSLGVIVHNRWAYERAVREHGDINRHIAHIPLLMPPVKQIHRSEELRLLREKYKVPADAFVFLVGGIIAPSKRPLQLLEAFRSHLTQHPDSFLVFVGAAEYPGVDFVAEITKRGLDERVKVGGFVEGIGTYNEYLALSDVCLALRYPSNGESSSSLLRMLAHGKPCIVTNVGSFADFPDTVVHKIPVPKNRDEVSDIADALRLLSENTEYRTRLGKESVVYVAREHSPEHCAFLYQQFIEKVVVAPETRTRLLTDMVGREFARLSVDTNEVKAIFPSFAAVIASN